jgi:VWFA-related protein
MLRPSLPLLVLTLPCLVVAGVSAQRVDPLVLSVRSDLVTLAVTVTDSRGAPITGLRQEQFTVYDEGEVRPIQFFSSEDLPASIGLVLDSSGSMAARRADLIAAVPVFASLRHPLDEYFAVHFNETVWPAFLPSGALFTEHAEQLQAPIAASPSRGLTALYDATSWALDQLDHASHDRRALVAISDGGDNASVHTARDVVEQARRGGVTVYGIALASPDDREARPSVLKMLARETGGRSFLAARPGDLQRSFARIADEITHGYTLAFVPADASDTGFRTVHVAVASADGHRLIARTRGGYYAAVSR